MKRTIGSKKDLKELAKLTLLNILSVQGVIYTHYKNKQLNKGKYEHNTIRNRNNQSS